MGNTYIITSGYKYIDIDAFACIHAYQELLNLKKQKAKAVITAKLNSSIISKYKKLSFYETKLSEIKNTKNKNFVIMDISNPDHFEEFVDINLVSNVFDHHSGFEKFWKEKIQDNSVIEAIGATATLIFREYKKSNLLNKITPISAELLATAIISNTTLFQAKITKKEDRLAYKELKKYFSYTENFESDYFLEVQNNIEKDLKKSMKNDSKSLIINKKSLFITQAEVWDTASIIKNAFDEIKNFITDTKENISFFNLVEIGKNRNLIIFKDNKSLNYIKQCFPEFEYNNQKNTAITSHIILRKEILTRIYEKH